MTTSPENLKLQEGRFARLEAIEWWDQERLAKARILVAGAGALGNEVIKNLALLGVGRLVIADMDTIELSNLSRSVLYRAADEGKSKAETAARAARDIYPEMQVTALDGNLLADVGLGVFRWADIIIGALDNREARVFLNSVSAQLDRPWIDGGIEVLQGIVRAFHAPRHACYECTMSQVDWDLLNKRRSCSLLARRALQQRGTPTTPTTASVIGALQAQEAVKLLHGMNDFLGRGFFFDGSRHDSFAIQYPTKPDCEWHDDSPPTVQALDNLTSETTLRDLWQCAEDKLGEVTELTLSREIIATLSCPGCQGEEEVFRPAYRVTEAQAWCAQCQQERSPELLHAIGPDSPLLDKTISELGLPPWDIIWARRQMDFLGLELSGDKPSVLGEHNLTEG